MERRSATKSRFPGVGNRRDPHRTRTAAVGLAEHLASQPTMRAELTIRGHRRARRVRRGPLVRRDPPPPRLPVSASTTQRPTGQARRNGSAIAEPTARRRRSRSHSTRTTSRESLCTACVPPSSNLGRLHEQPFGRTGRRDGSVPAALPPAPVRSSVLVRSARRCQRGRERGSGWLRRLWRRPPV